MSFSFEIRNLGDEFGMNLADVGVGGELAGLSAIAVGVLDVKEHSQVENELLRVSFDVQAEQS
jgi:hypothetical protein